MPFALRVHADKIPKKLVRVDIRKICSESDKVTITSALAKDSKASALSTPRKREPSASKDQSTPVDSTSAASAAACPSITAQVETPKPKDEVCPSQSVSAGHDAVADVNTADSNSSPVLAAAAPTIRHSCDDLTLAKADASNSTAQVTSDTAPETIEEVVNPDSTVEERAATDDGSLSVLTDIRSPTEASTDADKSGVAIDSATDSKEDLCSKSTDKGDHTTLAEPDSSAASPAQQTDSVQSAVDNSPSQSEGDRHDDRPSPAENSVEPSAECTPHTMPVESSDSPSAVPVSRSSPVSCESVEHMPLDSSVSTAASTIVTSVESTMPSSTSPKNGNVLPATSSSPPCSITASAAVPSPQLSVTTSTSQAKTSSSPSSTPHDSSGAFRHLHGPDDVQRYALSRTSSASSLPASSVSPAATKNLSPTSSSPASPISPTVLSRSSSKSSTSSSRHSTSCGRQISSALFRNSIASAKRQGDDTLPSPAPKRSYSTPQPSPLPGTVNIASRSFQPTILVKDELKSAFTRTKHWQHGGPIVPVTAAPTRPVPTQASAAAYMSWKASSNGVNSYHSSDTAARANSQVPFNIGNSSTLARPIPVRGAAYIADTPTQPLEVVDVPGGGTQYRCIKCSALFKDSNAIAKHNCQSKQKQLQCEVCGKRFTKRGNLASHELLHAAESNKELLKMKTDTTSAIKPFPCDICNRRFSHQNTLTKHKRTHTDERPYACDKCDKTFRQRSTLKEHMRVHTGERPYKCDFCNKAFSQSSMLTTHRRIHTGEKPMICEICGRGFSDHSHFSKHRRSHTGEKPNQCTICGKSFVASCELTRHMRTHSGEKPYRCDICGQMFGDKSHCRRHRRKQHPEAEPDGSHSKDGEKESSTDISEDEELNDLKIDQSFENDQKPPSPFQPSKPLMV